MKSSAFNDIRLGMTIDATVNRGVCVFSRRFLLVSTGVRGAGGIGDSGSKEPLFRLRVTAGAACAAETAAHEAHVDTWLLQQRIAARFTSKE